VCRYSLKTPDKTRAVLILTRDSALSVVNSVTIAPITFTIRCIPTEVVLTKDDGLPGTCAATFDNLQTVPKSNIGNRIAALNAQRMKGRRRDSVVRARIGCVTSRCGVHWRPRVTRYSGAGSSRYQDLRCRSASKQGTGLQSMTIVCSRDTSPYPAQNREQS